MKKSLSVARALAFVSVAAVLAGGARLLQPGGKPRPRRPIARQLIPVDETLPPRKRQDLSSALRTTAKAIGSEPATAYWSARRK